jgi:hypothetical protein
VGIIHMYGYWWARTPDGTVTTEEKRTEVSQRRDDQRVFIGAQFRSRDAGGCGAVSAVAAGDVGWLWTRPVTEARRPDPTPGPRTCS